MSAGIGGVSPFGGFPPSSLQWPMVLPGVNNLGNVGGVGAAAAVLNDLGATVGFTRLQFNALNTPVQITGINASGAAEGQLLCLEPAIGFGPAALFHQDSRSQAANRFSLPPLPGAANSTARLYLEPGENLWLMRKGGVWVPISYRTPLSRRESLQLLAKALTVRFIDLTRVSFTDYDGRGIMTHVVSGTGSNTFPATNNGGVLLVATGPTGGSFAYSAFGDTAGSFPGQVANARTQPWFVAARVKMDVLDSNSRYFIGIEDAAHAAQSGLEYIGSGAGAGTLNLTANGSNTATSITGSLDTTSFHDLMVAWDETDAVMTAWFDGVQVGTATNLPQTTAGVATLRAPTAAALNEAFRADDLFVAYPGSV